MIILKIEISYLIWYDTIFTGSDEILVNERVFSRASLRSEPFCTGVGALRRSYNKGHVAPWNSSSWNSYLYPSMVFTTFNCIFWIESKKMKNIIYPLLKRYNFLAHKICVYHFHLPIKISQSNYFIFRFKKVILL